MPNEPDNYSFQPTPSIQESIKRLESDPNQVIRLFDTIERAIPGLDHAAELVDSPLVNFNYVGGYTMTGFPADQRIAYHHTTPSQPPHVVEDVPLETAINAFARNSAYTAGNSGIPVWIIDQDQPGSFVRVFVNRKKTNWGLENVSISGMPLGVRFRKWEGLHGPIREIVPNIRLGIDALIGLTGAFTEATGEPNAPITSDDIAAVQASREANDQDRAHSFQQFLADPATYLARFKDKPPIIVDRAMSMTELLRYMQMLQQIQRRLQIGENVTMRNNFPFEEGSVACQVISDQRYAADHNPAGLALQHVFLRNDGTVKEYSGIKVPLLIKNKQGNNFGGMILTASDISLGGKTQILTSFDNGIKELMMFESSLV